MSRKDELDILDEEDEDEEKVEVVTRAPIEKVIDAVRARINKNNRARGGNYENAVAKRMAAYFGMSPRDAFMLSRHARGKGKEDTRGDQPHGDCVPIKKMSVIWYQAGLGPIETKRTRDWAFAQFLKDGKPKIYQYWLESNRNTNAENSLVIFSKPAVSADYVFHRREDAKAGPRHLRLEIEGQWFIVQTLTSFLVANFPESVVQS